MSIGQGNILVQQRQEINSGPPFALTSAVNGLSVDAGGRVVLGQNIGAVGDPAQLLSNREIPMSGFFFEMRNGAGRQLLVDPSLRQYALGDIDTVFGNTQIFLDDITGFINLTTGVGTASLGMNSNNSTTAALGMQTFTNPANYTGVMNFAVDSVLPQSLYSVAMFATGTATGQMAFNIDAVNEFFDLTTANGRALLFDFVAGAFTLGDVAGTIGNGNRLTIDNMNDKFLFTNTALNSILNINGVDGFTTAGAVVPVTITVIGGVVTNVT